MTFSIKRSIQLVADSQNNEPAMQIQTASEKVNEVKTLLISSNP